MESFFLVCKKFQVKITDTAAVFNINIYSNSWFYSQNEKCDFIRLMAFNIATGSVFWLWNSIGKTCVDKCFMESCLISLHIISLEITLRLGSGRLLWFRCDLTCSKTFSEQMKQLSCTFIAHEWIVHQCKASELLFWRCCWLYVFFVRQNYWFSKTKYFLKIISSKNYRYSCCFQHQYLLK